MRTFMYQVLFCGLALCIFNPPAKAQSSTEEIRAMADLCSTGASVKFRGEIAGGLLKLFGKVISGSGEVEISRNETEFLNNFKDERLRLEARRIYNECAIRAIETLKEKYRQQSRLNPEDLEVVNGASSIVPIGRVFRLAIGQSAVLKGGGVLSLRKSTGWRNQPKIKLTNRGSGTGVYLRPGSSLGVPRRRGCTITHVGELNQTTYNFLYECN